MAKAIYWYEYWSKEKKQKMILKKIFLSWSIMQFLEKLWKILENRGDIKLATTERKRNYLVSEPNYHTTNIFTENLLAIEMKKKAEVLINKSASSGLSILELNKILMYEFLVWSCKIKMWWKNKIMLYG